MIRRFSDNAAETKNMTAHDYEDLLQVVRMILSREKLASRNMFSVCHPSIFWSVPR